MCLCARQIAHSWFPIIITHHRRKNFDRINRIWHGTCGSVLLKSNIVHIKCMKSGYKNICAIDVFIDRNSYIVLIFKEIWIWNKQLPVMVVLEEIKCLRLFKKLFKPCHAILVIAEHTHFVQIAENVFLI